jgi:hypothetical protein
MKTRTAQHWLSCGLLAVYALCRGHDCRRAAPLELWYSKNWKTTKRQMPAKSTMSVFSHYLECLISQICAISVHFNMIVPVILRENLWNWQDSNLSDSSLLESHSQIWQKCITWRVQVCSLQVGGAQTQQVPAQELTSMSISRNGILILCPLHVSI